jgi:hypothetical protein
VKHSNDGKKNAYELGRVVEIPYELIDTNEEKMSGRNWQ